ncbi:hypothetical protein ACFSYG_05550 [Leeuwenhoekiella polynyae]|uniref:DUF3649 domain-containing protein n=1 Tax=Leeuwenhoekiella polynyae TaxID=1550906 RepID=A0A4Q0P2P7_9FLAO|nr:hypothetical protein [Leeuwenhoekiella polynyae]RXG20571.1 hypothetical protein DSM02_2424 [Leeuwenhoekiella polynyae]|tara:strand:+ start:387 stop:689 length:303 start_codon:yes stop_codon:yes gene_type:complete
MPANSKYLTQSRWQRFGKITAGILGGYFVAQTLHLAVAAYTSHIVVLITSTFSLFIIWAALLICAFLAKNAWKVWGIYIGICILLSVLIYLAPPLHPLPA